MWRWTFLILLVISASSTQPIFDYEGRECCPCPKPGPAPDVTASPRTNFMEDCPCARANQEGAFARFGGTDQDLAGTEGEGAFVRASAVDDCPCRLRNADSVGAPSVFFPSAMRPLWPIVSDKETKEDAKPLLHPEVGLASSVLETLREATDEEYQEVLARDAVKSVLRAPDVDAMSEVSSALDTARNIVNVILKPNDNLENRDDTESEASHVQESRCIHPLGKANNLNLQYSPTSVNEIFTTPQKEPITLLHRNRNIWDMDNSVGASDVYEQILDGIGHGLEALKLKSNPSLFNLFPEKNKLESEGQLNLNPFKDNKKISTNFKEVDTTENPLDALNRKIDNSLSDLKSKLDNHLQAIKNDNADKLKSVLDSVNSPSMTNFAFKPYAPTKKIELTTLNPLPFKSLLNLNDVELIPPVENFHNDFSKARSNVPELIPKHKNKDSSKDLFKNFQAVDLGDLITNGLKIGFKNLNNKGGTDNIQPIPKGIFKSGIVDSDTSPSEVKFNVHDETKEDNNSVMNDQVNIAPEAKNTEILEVLPKSYHNQNIENAPATNIECKSTDVESLNNNIIDLPDNFRDMPNTEIIDTVPSSTNVHATEFEEENMNNGTDDSNEYSRTDNGCKTDNGDIENDDSSIVSDSMENNREVINDDEHTDTINISQESETEQTQQENEETCLEDSVKQQDSVPEASDTLPNMVESPDKQRTDSSTTAEDSNEACTGNNSDEKVDEIKETTFAKVNPLFKKGTLSSLKENIINKIDNLKKPVNKNTMERKKVTNSYGGITDKEYGGEENTYSQSSKDFEPKNTTPKALDIDDLQDMSDKLLDLSNKKDQENFVSENEQCSNLPKSEVNSDQIQDFMNEKNYDDMDSSDAETSKDIDNAEGNDTETSNISENIDKSHERIETKNTCSSNLDQNLNTTPERNMKNEMAADSSDSVIERVAPEMQNKPSLLHNILRPKPLNVDTSLKLPGLNHVRDNLASLIEPKAHTRISNIEDENTDDSNVMSVDASAPTSQSILSSLQPLEDINLDIFQLRPLKLPDPRELLSQVPSLPRLNLNSYKAKLALPKGLNIKPMKLESSLGGKNGLLGATLTIGPDKGFLGKEPKLLGGPFSLNNLPTLEELHSTMRENAQNLLFTPLDITGRNIIDDSLRSSQTLTDNLRSHTKNTMKDIQQTFQTRLKDVQQSDLSILADPLKDPQEFFQAVSRTHEDVTDKLKAIHYDLNDRLESFRDRITDQSLLPTLNTPLMGQSHLPLRSESSLLSPSYSKPQKKLKTTKSTKSRPQSSSKMNSSRAKPAKSKTLKMPAAHSVPVPKTVEAPTLKTVVTSSPPPFVLKTPSFRTPQFLTNKKSLTDILPDPVSRFRDSKVPVFGKFKPTENRVKISFGTTTLRPNLSRNKPTLATRLNDRPTTVQRKPTFSPKITSSVNSGSSRFGSKLRPNFDANEAPSQMIPTKIKAPVNIEESKNQPLVTLPKKQLPELPKPKSILSKTKPSVNDRFPNGHSSVFDSSIDKSTLGSQRGGLADTKLGAPKNLDILASLREAVRARLSNLTPITNDKIVQPDTSVQQSDMLRSASENVESTAVDSLMRENASYTCKMVCTRNN